MVKEKLYSCLIVSVFIICKSNIPFFEACFPIANNANIYHLPKVRKQIFKLQLTPLKKKQHINTSVHASKLLCTVRNP